MAGTTWFTFTAGKKAKGSEVNSCLDWLEGSILPMNVGSSTTNVYDLGSASYKWRNLYISDNIYWTTTRHYSIAPADIIGDYDTVEYKIDQNMLSLRINTSPQDYYAPIHLPHSASITSIKTFWFLASIGAAGILILYRADFSGNSNILATGTAGDTFGAYQVVEDASPTNATIDNQVYKYSLKLTINPESTATSTKFMGAVITYEIASPLP